MLRRLCHLWLPLTVLTLWALHVVGCTTTVVTVTKPDGTTVRAERYAIGNRSEVGDLAVETPSVKGKLTGYVSDPAAGLQTIDKLVDKIPAP